MSHPMLLVVGSSPELMRRYMLEAAASDHPVLLLDRQEPTWQKPYIVDHEIADLHQFTAVCASAERLARRWDLAGIVTFDEYLLTTSARLAEYLSLPGNTSTAVAAARDKATSRQLFASADVPSAAFTWVHSMEAAAAAAERIGDYPVVLKPVSHAGSMGVVRVDAITDLPACWAIACESAEHQGPEGQGVLLEEYLEGPEISVETVTERGGTTAVAVTHKSLGFAPYFMETGHVVTACDPLLKSVAPTAAAALRAIGITHGVSHVEMKLTKSGPRLIEVNARLGGDRIGELVRYATGIDLAKAAADLALGRTPDLQPTVERSAGIGMVYPPGSGIVTGLSLRDGDDRRLEQFHWLCDIGDEVSLTPSPHTPNSIRAGFAIATGKTADDVRRRLDDVLSRALVEVRTTMARAA
ncbi:ATP-grasp domain-containing protein [Streptomyces sp. NPDC002867]